MRFLIETAIENSVDVVYTDNRIMKSKEDKQL